MNVKSRKIPALIGLGIAASAAALYLPIYGQSPKKVDPPVQTATGQYISPLAVPGAVQQFLNPGLAAYPNFIAGEAVRSRLSPDGKTLAVLCAGHNGGKWAP